MRAQPVFQRCINPRLPAVAAGLEGRRYIGPQTDGDAIFHPVGGWATAGFQHLVRGAGTEMLGKHFAGWARTQAISCAVHSGLSSLINSSSGVCPSHLPLENTHAEATSYFTALSAVGCAHQYISKK